MTDRKAVELLPVEQCDRDAAADYLRDAIHENLRGTVTEDSLCGPIRRGESDDKGLVQAFAKHRIASNPIADSGLADELERLPSFYDNARQQYLGITLEQRNRILSALRANPIGQSEGVAADAAGPAPFGLSPEDGSQAEPLVPNAADGWFEGEAPCGDLVDLWIEGFGEDPWIITGRICQHDPLRVDDECGCPYWPHENGGYATHWRPAQGMVLQPGPVGMRPATVDTPNPSQSKHPTASPGVVPAALVIEVETIIRRAMQEEFLRGNEWAECRVKERYAEATKARISIFRALATLTPSTERDSVLEEAAKVCEDQRRIFGSSQYAANQPMSSFGERFACGSCAEAIRALKVKPTTTDREAQGCEHQTRPGPCSICGDNG